MLDRRRAQIWWPQKPKGGGGGSGQQHTLHFLLFCTWGIFLFRRKKVGNCGCKAIEASSYILCGGVLFANMGEVRWSSSSSGKIIPGIFVFSPLSRVSGAEPAAAAAAAAAWDQHCNNFLPLLQMHLHFAPKKTRDARSLFQTLQNVC